MLHGPEYRVGSSELDSYRLKRRHGHYGADRPARSRRPKRLMPWIVMALVAVAGMVVTRNASLMGLLRDLVVAAKSEGCAIAHDLGRPRRGDPAYWGGTFDERGGCEHES